MAAERELVSRGMKIVPQLQRYIDDERHPDTSHSESSAEFRVSTGSLVNDIIAKIMLPKLHLPASPGEFEGQPYFEQYYRQAGYGNYIRWALRSTPRQQELAYLRWYIAQFKSKDGLHRRHLAPYINRIAELQDSGVATRGPLNRLPERNRPGEH